MLVGGGPAPQGPRPYAIFEDATTLQVRRGHVVLKELPTRGFGRRVETKRQAYTLARACCMTTPWAAGSVTNDFGIDPAKVHVVGIGGNIEAHPVEREWWPPRFLFIGVAFEHKNGPAAVRALGRLRREIPEAQLDVVGRHPPIDEPGVHGHGVQPLRDPLAQARVRSLLEQATCFVLPSVFDASPIACVDAATAGIPSIATSAGGAAFLVGDAGRICDSHDEDALLAAMRELSDPDTARALGAKAHERSRLFTWDAVAQRILRSLDLPGVDDTGLADFL